MASAMDRLRNLIFGRRGQPQQTQFDEQAFIARFINLPNDGVRYCFYKAQPLAAANACLVRNYGADRVGPWVNAIGDNALLNGIAVDQCRADPDDGVVFGPYGLIENPQLSWATVDKQPPAGFRKLVWTTAP